VPATVAGLEAGAMLRSSTAVGGDFFDVMPMGDRIGVAVGDVSGKGIPAALLMVMTRTLLREIARDSIEPGPVLAAAQPLALPGRAAVDVRHRGPRGAGPERRRRRRGAWPAPSPSTPRGLPIGEVTPRSATSRT
jgi:stage II sporulation SpoE-like protein